MSVLVARSPRTFPSNSALAAGLRVKLSAGFLVAAVAADDELGVLDQTVLAADTVAAVRLPAPNESLRVMASAAIAQYADVYRAAAGKISATPNGERWGIALEAASGDGSLIEVLRLPADAQVNLVEAHTADDALTAAEMYGSIHTSVGAGGTITLTLPAAVVGMHAKFRVGAAQELRIDPNGAEVISLPSSGVPGAAGKYLTANADGETVELVCTKAGQWSVYGFTGTWTAEL
ncbi:MAG: hypothetical protein L0211_01950 [Planctomycetaceae bacterium]|nr:hypothetical protein [Planctomycetaceae bacterium]